MKRKAKSVTAKGGAALKDALLKRKWTQVTVAEKLGVSKASVSRWISGERVPDRAHMAALRELLGISSDVWV